MMPERVGVGGRGGRAVDIAAATPPLSTIRGGREGGSGGDGSGLGGGEGGSTAPAP